MARLDRLFVNPIESLDATAVSTADIVENGALEWDRRYAIVDANGEYVNGKRESRIHRLRADFDLGRGRSRSANGGTSASIGFTSNRTAQSSPTDSPNSSATPSNSCATRAATPTTPTPPARR